MRLWLATLFALCATVPAAAERPASPNTCSNINPSVVRKCEQSRIEAKERLMSRLFANARRAVAKANVRYGRNDNRSDPAFLDASQAAWKRFAENNCTVIAAYNGGSNSAISDRLAHCYERELDRRIQFLRDAASGNGAFGF
jgi:uncharacterized protein YecT (DUF1311 family)